MEDTAKLESKESGVKSLKSQDPGMTPKILIKSSNWVGDVVMSIPAIKELRNLYPDSYIAVLIKQELVDLLANHPAINEVIPYKEGRGFNKLSILFGLSMMVRKKNFEIAILFPNSFSSALLVFLTGIPCRVGYGSDGRNLLLTNIVDGSGRINPCPTYGRRATPTVIRRRQSKSAHQTWLYMNIVRSIGILPHPHPPPLRHVKNPREGWGVSSKIYIKESDREWAVNLIKENIKRGKYLIGINPGARYGAAKQWLADRFIELGNRLIQRYNASIILFGGPEEKDFVSGISAGIKTEQGEALNMAGSTSLGQLVALIERCSVFITNDTGPMHIAYSVGTPLVAIFGSTDPGFTGPLGNNHRVVKKDVPCSPCFRRICPFDMECMKSVEVEDVMNAVESFIQ